jgi:hypothetical protein
VVKIEIKQELTFERQGFEGVMRIQNNLDSVDLTSARDTTDGKKIITRW